MIKKNARFLMTGDSITDCFRGRPVGEFFNLGSGYPLYFYSILAANEPELNTRVMNTGVGGDTISMLADRWDTDVIALKPDYVSVLIGINDVWRAYDHHLMPECRLSTENFEARYREIIEKTLAIGAEMFLLTPFFFERNKEDPMRRDCDKLGAIVKRLGEEYKLPVLDLQAEFDGYMKSVYGMSITGDRVHPNPPCHYIIADMLLGACGYDFRTRK